MIDPAYRDDLLTVYQGDCRVVLAEMPADSVDCVITSPPYWGLRDYGTAAWIGGDESCDHLTDPSIAKTTLGSASGGHAMSPEARARWAEGQRKPYHVSCGKCGAVREDGQLGLEESPEAYVETMVAVFREVRRVLRRDGVAWLNLGDTYADRANKRSDGESFRADRADVVPGKRNSLHGAFALKAKDRIGIPHRVVFALQADGWWWRDEVVWHKPNPMPSSVEDRTTPSHEMVFLMTKSARYRYDGDAIREAAVSGPSDLRKMAEGRSRIGGLVIEQDDPLMAASGLTNVGRKRSVGGAPLRRPRGWNDGPTEDDHVGRYIPGKHPRGWASAPGRGHDPQVGRYDPPDGPGAIIVPGRNKRSVWTVATEPYPGAHFATFPRKLIEPMILAGCPADGVVLDPFGGSGTVGEVARHFGRRAILVELNPDYVRQAIRRATHGYADPGGDPYPDDSLWAEVAQ